MTDKEFLIWLYQRLEHVHGENPNVDYMHKFLSIISNYSENLEFKKIYRGYVIRQISGNGGNMFVGPTSEQCRIFSRNLAERFTPSEAVKYIKNGTFCKDEGTYVIEDAT